MAFVVSSELWLRSRRLPDNVDPQTAGEWNHTVVARLTP